MIFVDCSMLHQDSSTEPPNIILIIADDMAWDDCGAYGHTNINTPNIDQLAKEGMRFTNAFLTTSSCSPSRASIITGKYPHQTNAEQLHWALPPDNVTFVEKLKEVGYWTAQAGKWHLGEAVKERFHLVAPVGTEGFVFDQNQQEKGSEDDGSGCQQWLNVLSQRPKDKPFFLWLAAVDPHRPYDNTPVNYHTLEDVRIPVYLPDNKDVRTDFVAYYNEISRLDQYVGKVVDQLDLEGITNNTLILFISDNGRPFPRDKTTLYDGGIKTPWIVKWPSMVQKGTNTDALVSSVDIATTFLSLAGGESPDSFVGYDFSKILMNPGTTIRQYIYAEDHWHDFEDYGRAIRSKQFKYIRNYYPDLPNTPPADAFRSITYNSMLQLKKDGLLTETQLATFVSPRPEEELFDMSSDSLELKNLAMDPNYYGVLHEMRLLLNKVREATNDQVPSERTEDEFDRETGQPLPNRIRPRPSKAEMFGEIK
jgi:arylsulfatase A-like enzyme